MPGSETYIVGALGNSVAEYCVLAGEIGFVPIAKHIVAAGQANPMSTSATTITLGEPFRLDGVLDHINLLRKVAYFGIANHASTYIPNLPAQGMTCVVSGLTHAIAGPAAMRPMELVGPAAPHIDQNDLKCSFKLVAFTNLPSTTRGIPPYFFQHYLTPEETVILFFGYVEQAAAKMNLSAAERAEWRFPEITGFNNDADTIKKRKALLARLPLSVIPSIIESLYLLNEFPRYWRFVDLEDIETLALRGVLGTVRDAPEPMENCNVHLF